MKFLEKRAINLDLILFIFVLMMIILSSTIQALNRKQKEDMRTGNIDSDTDTAELGIEAKNKSTSYDVDVGEELILKAPASSSELNNRSYIWYIGDCRVESGKKVSCSFSQAGKYNVKLIVTDEDGYEYTDEKVINVQKADDFNVKCENELGIDEPPSYNFIILCYSIFLAVLYLFVKKDLL